MISIYIDTTWHESKGIEEDGKQTNTEINKQINKEINKQIDKHINKQINKEVTKQNKQQTNTLAKRTVKKWESEWELYKQKRIVSQIIWNWFFVTIRNIKSYFFSLLHFCIFLFYNDSILYDAC